MTQVSASPPFSACPIWLSWLSPQGVGGHSAPPPPWPPGTPLRPFPSASVTTCRAAKNGSPLASRSNRLAVKYAWSCELR